MNTNSPSARRLDGLVVFFSVARLGSFRGAANELGVTPSAVSHAIRILEERIGVALVARTTRSVGLTEAGQILFDSAREPLARIDGAIEAAQSLGNQPRGKLRVTAPMEVVDLMLLPLLPQFHAQYPGIEVEISGDDRFVDIVQGGFDAGVRLGETIDADMIAMRLTPGFRFAIVASPAYLEKRGAPETPADLGQHDCIRNRQQASGAVYQWEFNMKDRIMRTPVTGPFIVNLGRYAIRLALDGLGLAYVAEPMVAEEIRDGRLTPVLEPYWVSTPGLYLYYPSRAGALPRLRAFSQFLRANADSLIASRGGFL